MCPRLKQGLHHNSAPFLPPTTGSPRRVSLLRAFRPLSTPSPSTMSWCSSSGEGTRHKIWLASSISSRTSLSLRQPSYPRLPCRSLHLILHPTSVTRSYQRDTPTMMFSTLLDHLANLSMCVKSPKVPRLLAYANDFFSGLFHHRDHMT